MIKIAMKRERVRTETLRRREALAPEVRATLSQRIGDAVRRWIHSEGFGAVMLYLSMRSEVETAGLLAGLLREGAVVCAPVVDTHRLQLTPRRIRDARAELVRHPFGMLEPNAETCPIFPTDRIQLIVVPGIAFDCKGYRLGYGKGFYDRFLAKCPHAVTVGLAYQTQIVKDTFPQAWDVPVQHIFTEAELIEV